MKNLSIITHFYNHTKKVLEQIEYFEHLQNSISEEVEFIIVDDCSTEILDFKKNSLNLKLLRINTDIKWNQGGARNLGFFSASGKWALAFDIDQKLTAEALPFIIHNINLFDSNTLYYLAAKNVYNSIDNVHSDFHVNSFLVNITQFKLIGMYDEDFSGNYGYEDIYMGHMWDANGGKRAVLKEPFFFDENLNFRTENLDRNLEKNHELGLSKLNSLQKNKINGVIRPSPFMRYHWNMK